MCVDVSSRVAMQPTTFHKLVDRFCPSLSVIVPWIHRLLGLILVMVVLKQFFSGWMSSVCLSCLQAAPAAEDPPSAEAPDAKPETKETGDAKADAVEEVKETAEASYVERCRKHITAASDGVGDCKKSDEEYRICILPVSVMDSRIHPVRLRFSLLLFYIVT